MGHDEVFKAEVQASNPQEKPSNFRKEVFHFFLILLPGSHFSCMDPDADPKIQMKMVRIQSVSRSRSEILQKNSYTCTVTMCGSLGLTFLQQMDEQKWSIENVQVSKVPVQSNTANLANHLCWNYV